MALTPYRKLSRRRRWIVVNEPVFVADLNACNENLVHIVFDNGVYEASGSKKTATAAGTDLVGMARAAGIAQALWAHFVDEFAKVATDALNGQELFFIGAKVSTERTPVLPYPMDEVENKYRFIRHVEKTEKMAILKPICQAVVMFTPEVTHRDS
jgi:hypothetical protein